MATVDDLISEIERSYDDLTGQLADPEVLGDRARYADAARAHAELAPVHELTQQYREAERTVADAEGLLGDDSTDAEMRAFAQDELVEGRHRLDELTDEIDKLVKLVRLDANESGLLGLLVIDLRLFDDGSVDNFLVDDLLVDQDFTERRAARRLVLCFSTKQILF